MKLQRRHLLAAALGAGWRTAAADTPDPAPAAPVQRLATAWQTSPGPEATPGGTGFEVAVLEVDWSAPRARVRSQTRVPSRAHGLHALPDGGFVAVANRPGTWLLRCDAHGQPQAWLHTSAEHPPRSLNGHVALAAEGDRLYSSETDPLTGQSWMSVRCVDTLQRVGQFPTQGVDAHQLLLAANGDLMVAHGGIVRDALGRKAAGERMAATLVRLDPGSGLVRGLWTLPDPQLSIRHIAWSTGPRPLLGVALQAEHGLLAQRQAAPALAVWDGASLSLPCSDTAAAGYTGDICAGPAGGFILSAQRQGSSLWWQPAQPQQLTLVADITQPCALAVAADGEAVCISGARGLARWHPQQPPLMTPWPVAVAPDNHWVELVSPPSAQPAGADR